MGFQPAVKIHLSQSHTKNWSYINLSFHILRHRFCLPFHRNDLTCWSAFPINSIAQKSGCPRVSDISQHLEPWELLWVEAWVGFDDYLESRSFLVKTKPQRPNREKQTLNDFMWWWAERTGSELPGFSAQPRKLHLRRISAISSFSVSSLFSLSPTWNSSPILFSWFPDTCIFCKVIWTMTQLGSAFNVICL